MPGGRHLFGLTGRLHSVRKTMEMVGAEINFDDIGHVGHIQVRHVSKSLAIVARRRDWCTIGPASEVRTGLRFRLRRAVLLRRPPAVALFLELSNLGVQLFHQSLKETTMRITTLLLIWMCCLIAAPAVWGQAANRPARPGILGYLDPHTGAFRPLAQAAEDAAVEPPALTTFTGTVTVTLTITLKSTGLSNIVCSADLSVEDSLTTGGRFLGEINEVAATGTGTTRTCKLSIPYSWGLATQSSDTMTTSYSVTGAGSTTGAPPIRSSTLTPLDSRKVPSSGTTTALTASVTI
jgi:hypothetical protein